MYFMRKVAASFLLIVLCCWISSSLAGGVDDEYIQNILVKYAEYVGNLKRDESSVIFDTLDYPYRKFNDNLVFVPCNEGVASITFVEQTGNARPITFLGEISYTTDGLVIVVSGLNYNYPPKYSMTIGYQDADYETLDDLVSAYNTYFDASLLVPDRVALNQIWDIPLGMDFEEAGKLLSEKLGTDLEREVDDRNITVEKRSNGGNPTLVAKDVLLRNQPFKVTLYSGVVDDQLRFNRLSLISSVGALRDENYVHNALEKFETLMEMMMDRFGHYDRSYMKANDRIFDAMIGSDGLIDESALSKIKRNYRLVFAWKNITLQFVVQTDATAIVGLTESDFIEEPSPLSEGVYDESKFGIQSF